MKRENNATVDSLHYSSLKFQLNSIIKFLMRLIQWIFVNQEELNKETKIQDFDELQGEKKKIESSEENWFKKYSKKMAFNDFLDETHHTPTREKISKINNAMYEGAHNGIQTNDVNNCFLVLYTVDKSPDTIDKSKKYFRGVVESFFNQKLSDVNFEEKKIINEKGGYIISYIFHAKGLTKDNLRDMDVGDLRGAALKESNLKEMFDQIILSPMLSPIEENDVKTVMCIEKCIYHASKSLIDKQMVENNFQGSGFHR